MAHVPLSPIGRPRDAFLDEASFGRYREAMAERTGTLAQRRDEIAAGWGDKYVQRVHQKGKRTARERIEALRDEVASRGRVSGVRDGAHAALAVAAARRKLELLQQKIH